MWYNTYMSITAQQVIDQANDYLGNYTTSTLDPGAKLRALNRSIEYIKRRLGLPSDETIQSFWFSEDQYFYNLNSDFDEMFMLKYHDPLLNTPNTKWDYMPYEDLMMRTGNGTGRFTFSHTTVNGRNQIMVLGQNSFRGTLIDAMDDLGNWIATGDASSLAVDTLEKYKGDASLSFAATYSTGQAILTDASVNLNLQSLFEKHGLIKMWTRLPNAGITNWKLVLYVDNSNYWTITETDQDDGTAFVASEFTKIGFPLDNAVETGTPSIDETITKIQLICTLPSTFVSGTIRVDHLFTSIPDKLDLIYYTRYKGTDQAGTTNKIQITANSDLLRIGDYFDDYIDVIARRMALQLSPQLRGDKDFYGVFQSDFNDMMKTLGKSFPRKRVQNNFLRHKIQR